MTPEDNRQEGARTATEEGQAAQAPRAEGGSRGWFSRNLKSLQHPQEFVWLFWAPTGFILMVVLLAALFLGAKPLAAAGMLPAAAVAPLVLGVSALGLLLWVPLSELFLRRELAWIARLPFRLEGYVATISSGGRGSATRLRLSVAMSLDVLAPEAERLAGLAGELGEGVTFERDDRAFTLASGTLEQLYGKNGLSAERMMRKWLKTATRKVLLPLHLTHRLGRVEVGSSS
jgi:hypothetical protein